MIPFVRRAIFRTAIAIGFLALPLGQAALAPALAQSAHRGQLPLVVEKLAEVQSLFITSADALEVTADLDVRISSIHFDGTDEGDIDAAIDAYDEDVTAMIERSDKRSAILRASLDEVDTARHRDLIDKSLDTINVLNRMLEGTPSYLRELLAAARAGDNETFDRLSHQSLRRTSALLRTENTLLDIQLDSMDRKHPTYHLQSSVRAGNEALALFTDAAARIFANKPAEAKAAAKGMRTQAALVRTLVKDGAALSQSIAGKLLLPSLTKKPYAVMRRIFAEEYSQAFAVELEFADHITALADALLVIDTIAADKMTALDDRTVSLVNRRIEIRQSIMHKLQSIADKL